MKTVLVAEDEKLIRKGLMTMVRRAPVEVGEILEARDGNQALEMLASQDVDLVITDIRMPGMDGLELVRRIRSMQNAPFILVISGYDDFSYAVEMLRNGVQNYLLKPVERESLFDSLQKIEGLLQERANKYQSEDDSLRLAFRSIMMDKEPCSAETEKLIAGKQSRFLQEPYYVVAARNLQEQQDSLVLQGERSLMVGIFSEHSWLQRGNLFADDSKAVVAGRSDRHNGLQELAVAYREAVAMWEQSFFTGRICLYGNTADTAVQPVNGEQTVGAEQLVRLIGMGRWQETVQQLRTEAEGVRAGSITPAVYASMTNDLYDQLCATYRSFLSDQDIAAAYISLWDCQDVSEYLKELENWIEPFSLRIQQEFADYENKQKIRQAVQYMQENFRTPLNMAIVSNQVSMNYSLFSLLFKQYTGMNFVSYLQNLRLEEAKKLLAETDWYVNEIGIRCGFQDDKHFLKVFKTAEGITPSQWRHTEAQMRQEK